MADHAEFLRRLLQTQNDLRMFIGSLVRDRQDREDVLQEVVVVLWEKFAQYDARRPFGAWARGVAANKIVQSRAKYGRTPTPFPPDVVAAVLDAFDRRPDRASREAEALTECLAGLPRRSREMLQLRYGESLEVKDLAPRFTLSAAAAYKALARLRENLRQCIERRLGSTEEGRS